MNGKTLKGFDIVEERREVVLLAADVLKKMISHINEKCGIALTEDHISFNIDDGVNKFYLNVNEEVFTEEEEDKCTYNLQEWFATFDQLLFEILEVSNEEQINVYHSKYELSDEYLIVTFKS